jgi:hypothetical protein
MSATEEERELRIGKEIEGSLNLLS